MYHTVERITGKPDDYIICNNCGKINWYERGEDGICNNCGMAFHTIHKGTHDLCIGFRPMTEKDGEALIQELKEDGEYKDYMELQFDV